MTIESHKLNEKCVFQIAGNGGVVSLEKHSEKYRLVVSDYENQIWIDVMPDEVESIALGFHAQQDK
jgi:hypothetical protein